MTIKPVYLDLHIHTSENANSLNEDYDLATLISNVKKSSLGHDFLISLTDHNTINKNAYLKLKALNVNFLVGVELSIRNYEGCDFYHCHLYFNLEDKDLESSIDALNCILDKLYKDKLPSDNDESVPYIQTILDSFDDFEYLVLPHGGQSHRTFDKSIPTKNVRIDTVMQRATYYNIFDGFTARNNNGLEKTNEYFKKLGISDFVNLITCSDNYNPKIYPAGKDKTAFVKTWMYSEPTFGGLRVSLSENNRLEYGDEPTDSYQEYVQKAKLSNDKIEIDVEFTPGLNVVIGNSSSGKTLLVDSVFSKISRVKNDVYGKYITDDFLVDNPSNVIPHYFSQNFILENILKIADNDGKVDLSGVTILNKIFKLNDSDLTNIEVNLTKLENNLNDLLSSAETINLLMDEVTKLPNLSKCIVFGGQSSNPLNVFKPSVEIEHSLVYNEARFNNDIIALDDLLKRVIKIPLSEDISKEIECIKAKLKTTYDKVNLENDIRKYLNESIKEIVESNSSLTEKDKASQKNNTKLLSTLAMFKTQYDKFYTVLNNLSSFNFVVKSKEIESSGHKLFVENKLSITKDDLLESFNMYLKKENRFASFDDICPEGFNVAYFSKKPLVRNMNEFKTKVLSIFKELNKTKYKILYKGKYDFDTLSPGIQSSIILDIILGYDKDNAPLIIDQPEDNLSTEYINAGLISKIKENKFKKQIIIVTHNATIPMLGDAQNVILCVNKDGKIFISSHKLEEEYEGKSITDWIAQLTDGGKASIKKRFKKYHIKDYREEET